MSQSLGSIATAKPKVGRAARREELEFHLFILPWLVGFVLWHAGPLIASIFISMTQWSMVKPPVWVGLENYRKLLFEDPLFTKTLGNTVYYAGVSVPAGMILAFLVAILMNQKVPGIPVFRTIYYLPAVVAGVAVAILWAWLFNPQFGLINLSLSYLGIQGPEWLFSTTWSMPAMILMSLWGIGGSMIIYLAGLQGIPEHLYEAAMIDGANWWAKWRHVTVPMMSPVIFFNLIMGTIGSFQVFTQIYIMTNGGPANSTLVYVVYLYRQAFEYFQMGYASALAWILFIIILIITVIQFRLAPRWVYYEGGAERR